MSLLVWLPLISDNHNQGLLDITPTNLGTVSFIDGGKLGKCLSAGTGAQTTNGIGYPTNLVSELGTQFSCAIWVRPLGTHVHYNGTFVSSGNWNAKCWSFGVNQNNTKVDIFSKGYNRYLDCEVPVNTWTHLCCTSDNGTVKLYKNGVYVGQATGVPESLDSDATIFCVGRETYASGYFSFNGNINDLRIYDHVLSPKEVKLLSQGLVCHYPLNEVGGKAPNLIESTVKSYTPTQYLAYQLSLSENMKANTKYTIQLWDVDVSHTGKSAADLGVDVYWGGGSLRMCYWHGTDYFTEGHADYLTATFYVTASTASHANAVNKWFNIYNSVLDASGTKNMSIGKWKLEVGSIATPWTPNVNDDDYSIAVYEDNIIYDSSGYNHNASIWAYDTLGEVKPVNDSARNSVATYINSEKVTTNTASGTWMIYGDCALTTPSYLTVAFWCKPFSGYGGSVGQGQFCTTSNAIGITAGTDYNTTAIHHRDSGYDLCSSTSVHKRVNVAFTAKEWHHYAVVYDGRYGRVYKDGVETGTADLESVVPLASFSAIVVGYSHAGGAVRSNKAYYSDFRIYATALSQEDIQQLYNTPVSVSNNGVVFTQGEFVEVTT